MNTLDRFQKYIEMENMVAEKVRRLTDFGATISRITPAPGGLTYDRVVILESGTEIKLEIQITEPKGWLKYSDVRLDLLSAFRHSPESEYAESNTVSLENAGHFLNSVEVQRYGKLYESEADVLAFYVPEPVDLLWLFRMKKLQEMRAYFVRTYGIKINKKSKKEKWQSCFVPVHFDDLYLDSAGVKYEQAEASAEGEIEL